MLRHVLSRVESNREICPTIRGNSSSPFTVACCPKESLHCAGCAEISETGDECNTCAGGYVKGTDGTCEACMDMVGWEDVDGQSCAALHFPEGCTEKKVRVKVSRLHAAFPKRPLCRHPRR